ncbi:MAG: hypothetical protein AB1634_11370 [Thermodesulfobacteriota bacterium]
MAFIKVFNALIRLTGWSPLGKQVLLRIDDAFERTLNGLKLAGRLTNLNQDGSAVIELERPFPLRDEFVTHVQAVPRHHGYDFYYLYWGLIAVELTNPNSMNVSTKEPTEGRIAIASLRIIKSSENRTT